MLRSNFAASSSPSLAASPDIPEASPEPSLVTGQSEFTVLIERLFRRHRTVAIIGCGAGETGTCERIAIELSQRGRRVALVSVRALLHSTHIAPPSPTSLMPGPAANVWLWPQRIVRRTKSFRSCSAPLPEQWLESLRKQVDFVLLDCPVLETAPGTAAIGAMAEAAVLVVESWTPKHQVLRDQRALQLSGMKLVGCILVKMR